jgi:hypothetical protein
MPYGQKSVINDGWGRGEARAAMTRACMGIAGQARNDAKVLRSQLIIN